MRRFAFALLALFVLVLPPSADATRKLVTVTETTGNLRLVVVTAPRCIYCSHFQKDIEPTYKNSAHATKIPLVYIDINDDAAAKMHLKTPVRIVPTVLLMDGNREINRITGYIGPSNFFLVLKHMLGGR